MRINLIVLLAIAALGAGCGGSSGERRARLATTQGLPDAGPGNFQPPFVCSQSVVQTYDCTMPFPLRPDGHITDFSNREWDNMNGLWCDESGFHGKIYSYTNSAAFPNDTHSNPVNTDDSSMHLLLSVTGGQYGGGGLQFDAGCLDVSAFTGVQFTAAVVSGSLTPCPLQLQLATFDQRPITPAPGGGCDSSTGVSCYGYPAATNIAVPSTDPLNPTLITLPFSSFSKVTGALTQVVGLQWQVNATSQCTVELALGHIGFIPATPGDGGSATD
ncbi:MAG TPA: hypothetical protein VKQ32_01195 [Polyangia bacterium]|nr:hypothetical protein [Polyangia bacterium]